MLFVLNLSTGSEHYYSGLTPRQAIIAAHAQSLDDWNTWNYEMSYGHLVRVSRSGRTISCGDCCTILK